MRDKDVVVVAVTGLAPGFALGRVDASDFYGPVRARSLDLELKRGVTIGLADGIRQHCPLFPDHRLHDLVTACSAPRRSLSPLQSSFFRVSERLSQPRIASAETLELSPRYLLMRESSALATKYRGLVREQELSTCWKCWRARVELWSRISCSPI